ncbi:hypothetical protein ABVK25_001826 [Lepraria finkii]|uniref:Uncharacterized protein n=1 Tax=Lepraria finkii TaxID=1340010 RepID=A0ABR4BQ53_9LECA
MFKGWMNIFLSAGAPSDQSVAQLKTQFTPYDDWITAFFSQAGTGAAPAAPASAAPAAASAPAISLLTASAASPMAASGTAVGASPSSVSVTSPMVASVASLIAASGTAAGASPPTASATSPAASGSTPTASGPLPDSKTAPPAVFNAGTTSAGTAGTAAPDHAGYFSSSMQQVLRQHRHQQQEHRCPSRPTRPSQLRQLHWLAQDQQALADPYRPFTTVNLPTLVRSRCPRSVQIILSTLSSLPSLVHSLVLVPTRRLILAELVQPPQFQGRVPQACSIAQR